MSVPPRVLRAAVALTATAAGTAALTLSTPAAQAAALSVSPKGSVMVTARGNGHGHGMSQYGAYGAARKGRSYAQILAFYYPGTKLTSLPSTATIRVRLSGFPTSAVTVFAEAHTGVTGSSADLPVTGVSRYRLVPAGAGFTLQQLKSARGSTWRTYRTGLPDGSQFRDTRGWTTRVFRSDGTSTRYFGRITAMRSGSGAYLVNRVGLDQYTAGVVSSEMPTSWSAQAVDAQAVAARTYGRYEAEHTARGSHYDICDTTDCQVYGGRAHLDRAGRATSYSYPAAARATSNRVLTYRGSAIFSQFSASNGGYMADGGQPYLRAGKDPYDVMSGNPYASYKRKVSVSSLASWFGLGKITSIAITKRDGAGTWGGRVVSASLRGTTSSGKARTVTVSGSDLQWALGLGTTLFTLARA